MREANAAASRRQRIEQAHLDVRNCGEAAEQLILDARVKIVDQQADANAALGRVAQLAQELQADAVVMEVVVLNVERERGTPRQRESPVQGEVAGRQQTEARFAGARLVQAGVCEHTQRGLVGVGEGRRGDLRLSRRQARAAGKRRREREEGSEKRRRSEREPCQT